MIIPPPVTSELSGYPSDQWKELGASPREVFNWGVEHKEPSEKTVKWSGQLAMTTKVILVCFIFSLVINIFQSYQTNKLLAANSEIEKFVTFIEENYDINISPNE